MTEKELIQKCKHPKGQRQFYDWYVAAMTRLCLRYLQNESDAFEVLNAGFLKIFKNHKKFKYQGEGSLDAWIRKIMVNECLMLLRKKSRMHPTVSIHETFDVSEEAVSSLDSEYLYEAIRKLPDGYRVVFNLYAIEGYSHKEIGEKLGIAESSSRSQLTHARRQLKELINPYFK